eukprot:3933442-Pyramimonas_sp.AAC.1
MNGIAFFTSIKLAERMPATKPVLSPTLAQPMLHCIWVYVLTSQSSIRAANKTLYFAFRIFFA